MSHGLQVVLVGLLDEGTRVNDCTLLCGVRLPFCEEEEEKKRERGSQAVTDIQDVLVFVSQAVQGLGEPCVTRVLQNASRLSFVTLSFRALEDCLVKDR